MTVRCQQADHARAGARFFVLGRPTQDKKRPLGGQQAEGVAWGYFLSPGRPKTKSAPSGGSKPKAQRGGHFFVAGPPQDKKRPLGGGSKPKA